MWYALYQTANGALLSLGSVLAEALPEGAAVREYADRPDQGALTWDAATRDFVPRPPHRGRVDAVDFVQRFTPQEWIACRQSEDTQVQYLVYLVERTPSVNMDAPLVAQGLGYLEHVGLIAPGRAAEILGGA